MISFDLRCARDHVFEGWFGSSAAYEDQRTRGLVACPLCGDTAVGKALMAPAIPSKGNRGLTPADAAKAKAVMAGLAAMQAKVEATSEWVGTAFATEARAMHDGDKPERPIYGATTRTEAKALVDDGVPVAPLPFRPKRIADA